MPFETMRLVFDPDPYYGMDIYWLDFISKDGKIRTTISGPNLLGMSGPDEVTTKFKKSGYLHITSLNMYHPDNPHWVTTFRYPISDVPIIFHDAVSTLLEMKPGDYEWVRLNDRDNDGVWDSVQLSPEGESIDIRTTIRLVDPKSP
ncbi:MAG TPA: hypothetical protein ENJ00_06780 [Phycisphaerales bacterium]|nr:hypothetical protein [Phycisphaerales bacterium]